MNAVSAHDRATKILNDPRWAALLARLTRRSAAQLGIAPSLPVNVQIKSVALME